RADELVVEQLPTEAASPDAPFDRLIENWFPLTYVLNNLNRGLGLPDGYPFVLSPPAVKKLRFVHQVVSSAQRNRESSPVAAPTETATHERSALTSPTRP